MQVGSAQKRALIALAEDPEGVGEVPYLSAPGLINKGLVNFVGRANWQASSPYICQITEAGRAFVARATRPGLHGDREARNET